MSRLVLFICMTLLVSSCHHKPKNYNQMDEYPKISPDYIDITVPCDIAPLNFISNDERCPAYIVVSLNNRALYEKYYSGGIVKFKHSKWKAMLEQAKGNSLSFEIYIREKDEWKKFKTYSIQVSQDPIDKYLAYRLINTGYVLWNEMGIYQRNLTNFEETPIFENRSVDHACINCHSFCNNNPDQMIFHLRQNHAGTLLVDKGKVEKINLKTPYVMSAGVYPKWHPDGKHIVLSVNRIGQLFSTDLSNSIEVCDEASDIVVYDIEKNEITTSPDVSTNNRENMPCWSADGKSIFYISSPPANDYESKVNGKYSLCHITYDVENNIWGKPDTILSSANCGLSVTLPRVSPDGKYMIFTLSDNGYFSIFHSSADLYVMDLTDFSYRKMEINSDYVDSYHSWSSNGRWIVFSSKRMDKLCTRPFICHFDKNGKESKAFVLPQEDPEKYHYYLKNYNVPEFITGKVTISPTIIRDVVLKDPTPVEFDKSVDIDALSGATYIQNKDKK